MFSNSMSPEEGTIYQPYEVYQENTYITYMLSRPAFEYKFVLCNKWQNIGEIV